MLSAERVRFIKTIPSEIHAELIGMLDERVEGDEGFVYVSSITRMGNKVMLGVSFVETEEEIANISPAGPQHFLLF